MAYWGVAYAYGPHVNKPMDAEDVAGAWDALSEAVARRSGATPLEQEYIAALEQRYRKEFTPDRSELDRAFADAMRNLVKRHPDDLDAQTLFAEALMNTMPWDYWTRDRTPKPETAEILAALQFVLSRNPDHPGANHFYIHAVEAGPNPEAGLPAADRLRGYASAAGHLVHMPSHIYMRVGQYDAAAAVNEKAIAADREYIAQAKPSGEYPMMYYPHNIDFLWAAAAMDGQSAKALSAARDLASLGGPELLHHMPMLEYVPATPTFVMARFGQWDAILAEPEPPQEFAYWSALWHYARGLAYTRKGDLAKAEAEQERVAKAAAEMPADRKIMIVNSAKTLLEIAAHDLAGEIAAAQGKTDLAVRELGRAVELQDGLRYMEPPPWYFPERQALGAVLLKAGRARQAEAVYREDLARHPENIWSLRGLEASLRAQKKTREADAVEARFAKAATRADVQLASSRL